MLKDEFQEKLNGLNANINFLKKQTAPMQVFYSEILKLTQLLLVMPATNTVSERTFSALHVIKNNMNTSNISKKRLDSTMLIYVYKDRTVRLDILNIATKFVANSDHKNRFLNYFHRSTYKQYCCQQNIKLHKQIMFYYPS